MPTAKKIKYVGAVCTSPKLKHDKHFKDIFCAEAWTQALTKDEKQYLGTVLISKTFYESSGELTIDEFSTYNAY